MTFLKKRRSIHMYRTRDDEAANIKLELPEDTLIVKRADLREIVHEVLTEIRSEQSQDGEIMTIKETAEFLKVSIPTVRNMIASKEIPFFQRGQVIRLNRRDVREWLRKNSIQ